MVAKLFNFIIIIITIYQLQLIQQYQQQIQLHQEQLEQQKQQELQIQQQIQQQLQQQIENGNLDLQQIVQLQIAQQQQQQQQQEQQQKVWSSQDVIIGLDKRGYWVNIFLISP